MSNNNFVLGIGQNNFYNELDNNELNGLNNQIEQMRQIKREINDEINRLIHYDIKSAGGYTIQGFTVSLSLLLYI